MADFPPAHPGDVLREDFLKPLKLSQYALAKAIGVPQIRVSDILAPAPNSGSACRRPTTWKWRATKSAPRSKPVFSREQPNRMRSDAANGRMR